MSAKGAARTTPPRRHTLAPLLSSVSIDVTLDADALRHPDPLARLLAPLAEIPVPRPQLGLLGTILSELYGNALEHGVLGLDSRWKRDAQGFERYVVEREEGLARLRYGWIRIALSCSYGARRGVATIRVDDSGPGFDRMRLNAAAPDRERRDVAAPDHAQLDEHVSSALHGRGLAVIRALGARLFPGKGGRGVCALYRWKSYDGARALEKAIKSLPG